MASDPSLITVADGVGDYVGSLQGRLGNLPTAAEIRETRGEATGPAYQYHVALDQLGQHVADEASSLVQVLDSLQSWMGEVVADLSQTDEEAAALLRRIQGEVESFGAGASARGAGSANSGSQQPVDGGGRTSTGWNV